jgi:hypothetical protein
MPKFLDAEKVLSSLRNDDVVLTNETHLISFDDKTNSDDLEELERRCAELGYTFEGVKIFKRKNGETFFAYDMKQSK